MDEVRRIRRERGMSQTALATASGVDRATLNQVELGRRSPTIATLERLAVALGVEVADFFPKVEPPLFPADLAQRTWTATWGARGEATEGTLAFPGPGEAKLVPLPIPEAEIRRFMEPVERGEATADEAARALAGALTEAMRAMMRGGGHAPAT